MTISEFQAWLDGFSEAIDGAPTPAQWEKIKEKVATLQSVRLTDVLPPILPPPYVPRHIGSPMWTGPNDVKWPYVTTCAN